MNKEILSETKNYLLVYDFELPVLLNKTNNERIELKEHYGDPRCGVIDEDEKWCAVGGEGVSIYFFGSRKETRLLHDLSVYSMKIVDRDSVHIIVDPWSEKHGTWRLNLQTLEIRKIDDDPDFRELPYKDCIE